MSRKNPFEWGEYSGGSRWPAPGSSPSSYYEFVSRPDSLFNVAADSADTATIVGFWLEVTDAPDPFAYILSTGAFSGTNLNIYLVPDTSTKVTLRLARGTSTDAVDVNLLFKGRHLVLFVRNSSGTINGRRLRLYDAQGRFLGTSTSRPESDFPSAPTVIGRRDDGNVDRYAQGINLSDVFCLRAYFAHDNNATAFFSRLNRLARVLAAGLSPLNLQAGQAPLGELVFYHPLSGTTTDLSGNGYDLNHINVGSSSLKQDTSFLSPNKLSQEEEHFEELFVLGAITGGGNVVLNADTGTYAVTGNDIVLAHTLALDAGTYSLTGNASAFDSALNVDLGAYSLTGNAIVFSSAFNIDLGTYSTTGNAITFDSALIADAGSYTITGLEAETTAEANVTMDADLGTYAITGNTVVFDTGLNADLGSYAISGNTAQFDAGFNLDLGSYAITGNEAETITDTDTPINIDLGTYAITGNDAVFDMDSKLETGSYAITGNAVDFVQNTILQVDAGSYGITGNETSASIVLVADEGAYNINGLPVSTVDSGADPGEAPWVKRRRR